MTIEGRPVVVTLPTEEQVAEQRATVETLRREREEAVAQSAPVNRRLLEAGPPLRDIDAALGCPDSCHPRVDVTDRHAGGTTCMCQQTPEQRAEGRRRFLEDWPTFDDGGHEAAQQAEAARTAARLGVDVHQIGGLIPFTITATVDGRSFFLRARHEVYRLELAPEDDPGLFTDGSNRWGVGELEIATGDDDELGSYAEALELAVRRVRDYLRQQGCGHVLASESGTAYSFCPLCGVRATDLDGAG